jgi:hypothetical protein
VTERQWQQHFERLDLHMERIEEEIALTRREVELSR